MIRYENVVPTPKEYNRFRRDAGWPEMDAGAALAYGPVLATDGRTRPLLDAVLDHALGGNRIRQLLQRFFIEMLARLVFTALNTIDWQLGEPGRDLLGGRLGDLLYVTDQ